MIRASAASFAHHPVDLTLATRCAGEAMPKFQTTRTFGRVHEVVPIPNLMALQVDSYQRFLQEDVQPRERTDVGLEAILREVFPIESYDGQLALEYMEYELGKPRYTAEECRRL